MSISEDNSKMSRSKPIDFDKFKFRRAEGSNVFLARESKQKKIDKKSKNK